MVVVGRVRVARETQYPITRWQAAVAVAVVFWTLHLPHLNFTLPKRILSPHLLLAVLVLLLTVREGVADHKVT